jgi:acyl-CoA hydrolase
MTNDDKTLRPRPVRESISEMVEIVLPNDANPLNALLGGRLMHWIDLAGAMAAHRHSRAYVVTASVDHMDFLVPVRVGDFVVLRSSSIARITLRWRWALRSGWKIIVLSRIATSAPPI